MGPKCRQSSFKGVRQREITQTQRKGHADQGSSVIMEAEIGVMLSQATECLEPPEPGRGKACILP